MEEVGKGVVNVIDWEVLWEGKKLVLVVYDIVGDVGVGGSVNGGIRCIYFFLFMGVVVFVFVSIICKGSLGGLVLCIMFMLVIFFVEFISK